MRNYYKHQLDFIVNIRKIITIEYMNLEKDFFLLDEYHNFYEFVYVDSGSAIYNIDNTTINLKQNQILILEPKQRHSIKGNQKFPTSLFIICFECSSPYIKQLHQFTSKLSKNEKKIIQNIIFESNSTYILPLYDKKVFKENPLFGGEQVISLYFELLLITLIRKTQNNNSNLIDLTLYSSANNLLSLITDYLEKNIYRKIDIPSLCKNFNYSKSFICKYFKDKTGETIIDYFNNLKIKEAKRMLLETNYTSEQISDLLSFSDPRYFLYLFKKITNMTPKEYKNRKVNSFNLCKCLSLYKNKKN